MKRRIAIVLGLMIFATGASLRAETDEEVEAHKSVLDLTGAFSNEGFKLRDGHWVGTVSPKERTLIAVNLYAGNQYWFAAAANEKAKKISVDLFDENGKQVVTESYNSGEKAAAGYSPQSSGQYFVSLGLLEGESTTFCLVYSYK
ncbi:MAG: hypothetical protein QOH88_2116 [Verrucomicrobiota bacterium]|jgi:hypothetical protein